MNLKNQLSTWSLVGVLVLSPVLLFGQPQRPEQRRGDGPRANTESSMGLELTEAQKEQSKTIRMNAANAILPIANQANEQKAKLRTLETAKEVDMKAINQGIDNLAKINADIQKIKAKSHQDFRALLTDEQRILFDTKFSKQEKGRMNRKEGQGPPRRN